jgi:DNA-binding Lrp family transcriptional regulator
LTPRPFAAWSAKIGIDSAEFLVRIQRLKKEGALGGIKAILDPRAFHYQSAWVAAQFSPEELKSCAEVFGQHSGVVYGCEREHEFNFWFFIAVPAGHDLELHVRCLEKLAGAQRTLFLPVRGVFKGTDLLSSLDAEIFPAMSERFEKRQSAGSLDLTQEEIGMIRQLQEPFPLTDEPYQKIAADLRITEAEALERIVSLAGKGCLKRIGSFLRSGTAAPAARMLVVWQIPEEKLERIGPAIAGFREVLYSDCRPSYPEFPYSLYTMIRAENVAELEGVIRRMQEQIGKWPYRALETVRELKKERMKYFPKELDAWWRENRHVAETAFH